MYYYEEELSPTDTSEDSIEISVKPIHKKFTKNKRKTVEPRRVKIQKIEKNPWTLLQGSRSVSPDYNENDFSLKRKCTALSHLAPKKRFKLDALLDMEREKIKEEQDTKPLNAPFRPWADSLDRVSVSPTPSSAPSSTGSFPELPCFRSSSPHQFPQMALPLIFQYALQAQALIPTEIKSGESRAPVPEQDEPLSLVVKKNSDLVQTSNSIPVKEDILNSSDSDLSCFSPRQSSSRKQTNYKSMTKDRRVEANARERQRVHTITSAFDTLQAAIPTEDENLKLSKLSVIKIATAYIMALSRMAGYDYTEDKSAPSVETVLKHCRETICTETKIKKRN